MYPGISYYPQQGVSNIFTDIGSVVDKIFNPPKATTVPGGIDPDNTGGAPEGFCCPDGFFAVPGDNGWLCIDAAAKTIVSNVPCAGGESTNTTEETEMDTTNKVMMYVVGGVGLFVVGKWMDWW